MCEQSNSHFNEITSFCSYWGTLFTKHFHGKTLGQTIPHRQFSPPLQLELVLMCERDAIIQRIERYLSPITATKVLSCIVVCFLPSKL